MASTINPLEPGASGLPAPRPADAEANPPLGLKAGPRPASAMQSHFMSEEDKAELMFDKVKKASDQLAAMRKELDRLASFADTVSFDDVVESASGMVAAGIPAAEVAAELAEMPETPAQLQTWVTEQSEKLKPREQQMEGALAQAGNALGQAAFRGMIAHSAEDHFQKQKLAAAPPQGRA